MRTTLIPLISFLFLLSTSVSTLYAQIYSEGEEWFWYNAESVRHTRAELEIILAHHKIWLTKVESVAVQYKYETETDSQAVLRSPRRVYMFRYTRPENAFDSLLMDLAYHPFRAKLESADLRRADLGGANLTWASLARADLTGASLEGADLTGASLYGADLTGAWLDSANLTRASLQEANVTGANLFETNMNIADLYGTNMSGVVFQPDTLPQPQDIAFARNLSKMTYWDNPGPLIELRKRLREAGYRRQAKEVNAAYRRTDATWLETFLYDWTCEYGIAYNRPFIILGAGIFIFGALYFNFARVFRSGTYNYLLATRRGWKKERDEGEEDWQEVRAYWRTISVALLFSLQRALRIGYRQFSPDSWIKMMLPPKFEITSRGWPRFVSAIQSIIGIGLVILALLSYFGSPFEY